MRKVVVDNEYNGAGDDEGKDDNILEAPRRYCPRDRRFTPLLGAEKELFALLLLDSLDTLCFLLIFY